MASYSGLGIYATGYHWCRPVQYAAILANDRTFDPAHHDILLATAQVGESFVSTVVYWLDTVSFSDTGD